MYTTEAWVLYRGEAGAGPGHLEFESISFPSLSDDEVLIEPLYGAWEANMSHAVDRDPVDICDLRGEEKVVLGNSGVVRVLDVGRYVRNVQPGQYCLFAPVGESDPFGYQQTVHGYDAPGTIGTLARKTKIACTGVYPLPSGTKFSLQQWAAFSLRYIAAWSNWSVAYRCFRVQLSIRGLSGALCLGLGGGCTLAELDLAQRVGCEAVMLSGNDRNIKDIENCGITTIDRRSFPDLNYDRKRYAADEEYRNAYRLSEYAFLIEVRERTAGNGVSIFVDYIGSPGLASQHKGALAPGGADHGGLETRHGNSAESRDGMYQQTHIRAYSLSSVRRGRGIHGIWRGEWLDAASRRRGYLPVRRCPATACRLRRRPGGLLPSL